MRPEKKEPDLDPIVRYDAFDCLTFVEEAMALAIGEDVDDVVAFAKNFVIKEKKSRMKNETILCFRNGFKRDRKAMSG